MKSADAQIKSSEASLVQSKAALNQATVNLGYTVITSPIDGIIISRNVDPGQTVAASMNAPTLFVIAADLTKMQVVANIDESDVGRMRPGQTVGFRVDAYPTETFNGTRRAGSPAADGRAERRRLLDRHRGPEPAAEAQAWHDGEREHRDRAAQRRAARPGSRRPVPSDRGDVPGAQPGSAAGGSARRWRSWRTRVAGAALATASLADNRVRQPGAAHAGDSPGGGRARGEAHGCTGSTPAPAQQAQAAPPAAADVPHQLRRVAAATSRMQHPAAAVVSARGGGRGGFDPNMTPEERRKRMEERMATMTPEERARFQERMKERQAQGGGGFGGGQPGGGQPGAMPGMGRGAEGGGRGGNAPNAAASAGRDRDAASPATSRQALRIRAAPRRSTRSSHRSCSSETRGRVWVYENKQLKSVPVRLGVTDGTFQEVIEGDIKEGQEVVVNMVTGLEPTNRPGQRAPATRSWARSAAAPEAVPVAGRQPWRRRRPGVPG